eukprot:COSAG06_NODE_36707_length_443_cov_13.787791_1_plen_88_part_10
MNRQPRSNRDAPSHQLTATFRRRPLTFAHRSIDLHCGEIAPRSGATSIYISNTALLVPIDLKVEDRESFTSLIPLRDDRPPVDGDIII